jgi:opacity protein-like surface antigen
MKIISAIITVFALMPAVSSAAQMIEIAPFAGQRYGGNFSDIYTSSEFEVADARAYGLILDFDSEPNKQIEIYLSRQNTRLAATGTFTGNPLFDLTIDYYHIGGLYMFPTDELPAAIRPFVSGSIGLTRMVPKRSDLTTENRLSASLGGGAKYFFSKNVGMRFDVRGIYTVVNSDTAVFCSGGCSIWFSSNGFVQTEVSAVLMMRF